MIESFSKIKALVFDIDGVLTDGSVTLFPNGEQIRKMHVKDGNALQLAVKKGYHVAIISGGSSEESKKRLQGLGIQHIYLKSRNKSEDLKDFLSVIGCEKDHTLYMGDDIPDFEVLSNVGLASCPSDAVEEIKKISHFISSYKGGHGCVREVIEKVLRSQNQWFDPKNGTHTDFVW